MIIRVPKSLEPGARRDIENFIRDIANITERGAKPFFRRVRKIKGAFKKYKNPFDPFKKIFPTDYRCLDEFKRYIHIDLGHTGDSVGIAMAHVPYFVDREEIDTNTREVEFVQSPVVKIDFWGKIRASKRQEIILSDIREIIYDLSRRGFYFGLISFDRFQSLDSLQILRRYGYTAGHFSVDRTTSYLEIDYEGDTDIGYKKKSTEGNTNAAHVVLRDLIYDDRILLPDSSKWYDIDYLEEEIRNAQETKTGKVDHPPSGSIDVEQAVAGASTHCVINEKMLKLTPEEEDSSRYEDKFYQTVEEGISKKLLSNDFEGYSPTDPRNIR